MRGLMRILPALAALSYASLVLLLRHPLARAGLWQGALALPRVGVAAWALWVGIREGRGGAGGGRGMKDEGPEANPEPSATDPRRLSDGAGSGSAIYPGSHLSAVPLPRRPGFGTADRATGSLPPSLAIGILLALGAGACVVGGLWGEWDGVRAMSGASWLLVAVVALRTKRA
jgi:hypothetical protein